MTLAPEQVQRSWTAVKRFKKDLNELQSLARAFAKNPKLKVVPTAGTPRTDGRTIALQVPIEYGDDLTHDRRLCGSRDEDLILRCEACAVKEDIFITLVHELAHLTGGTFEEVTDEKRAVYVDNVVKELAAGNAQDWAKQIKARIEALPPEDRLSLMRLANEVSEYLGFVLNAVEDVRVNVLMKSARKGTQVMFAAQTNKIFKRGVERADGTVALWSDAPVNLQIIIGIYCMVSELNYESWLKPEVVSDLEDPVLRVLGEEAKNSKTVFDNVRVSIKLLQRLRELGYCRHENDPEEPQPSLNKQPQQGGQGNPQAGDPGDSGDNATGDGDPGQGTPNGTDDTEGSDATGDDSGAENGGKGDTESQEGNDDPASSGNGDDGDDSGNGEADGDGNCDGDSGNGDAEGGSDAGSGSSDDGEGGGDTQRLPSSDPGAHGADHDDSADDQLGGGGDDASSSEIPGEAPGTDGGGLPGDGVPGGGGTSSRNYLTSEEAGTPEEIEELFNIFGRHDPESEDRLDADEKEAVEVAISQEEHFDNPSEFLGGLVVRTWKSGNGSGWRGRVEFPTPEVPEPLLSKALTQLRFVFSDNRRSTSTRHLKHGKLDARVLGKRIPTGDPRLFKKRTLPGKKDYAVLLGVDISGSQAAGRYGKPSIYMTKAAVLAQAMLMKRMGITFAVFAHTATHRDVEIYVVKDWTEPWGREQEERLQHIRPTAYNLDGHSMEFYRKQIEKRPETDKLLMYYTDGAINNIGEEWDVFTHNVEICHRKGIVPMAVEIATETGLTEELGMPTVALWTMDDLRDVISFIKQRLSVRI